ncbi:MAG TPA: sialidase family protein [Verrucomicrobiaceae bacterium]|jgi:hypothetical protein
MGISAWVTACMLGLCVLAPAQGDLSNLANPFIPLTIDQPRTSPEDRPGPWDQDVLVYRVLADGKIEPAITFERAGVPTMTRVKDGRLVAAYQNFPKDDPRNFDRVAVRFSSDDGKIWSEPQPIVVEGMGESRDGGWIVAVTGEPRAGTASARRMRGEAR